MEPLTYITFFGALFCGLFVGWFLGSEKYKLKMRLRDLERKPQIKHYRTIDHAVHSLDYKMILKAMEAVGWKYADKDFHKEGDIPTHTPTIPELCECATMVCTDAVAYLEEHPGESGIIGAAVSRPRPTMTKMENFGSPSSSYLTATVPRPRSRPNI